MFKQTETPVCRFCLVEYEHPANPLMEPCECKGSVAFVHKKCIQQWRNTTTNRKSIQVCQLCLTDFKLPLRYANESIPEEERRIVWSILSRPHVVWFLSNLFHFSIFIQFIFLTETVLQSHHTQFSEMI